MTVSKRPPPLQLLPAFEAAARLLSFSKAAKELHLTTSAISQQIKQLENSVGQPLFRRLTRRLELTPAGLIFSTVALETLTVYRKGYAKFTHDVKQEFRISMTPLIAHEFILPHLSDFQSSHLDVNISIESSMDVLDFDDTQIDAAIRVGDGQWKGLKVWSLSECRAVILAAPSLLERLPIDTPQDLNKHTLIRRQKEKFGWSALASQFSPVNITGRGTLTVDTDLAALHAAEQGLGIAISFLPASLTTTQVWPEHRVTPVFFPMATPLKVYFVFHPSNPQQALLYDMFLWLKDILHVE